MQLQSLVAELEYTGNIESVNQPILGIAQHCEHVQTSYIFVALLGATTHGNAFISEAIARGAVAILTDTPVEQSYHVPVVHVPELNTHLPLILKRMYPEATNREIIAVTGTNGKTTVAHFCATAFDYLGHTTQVIGTLTHARTTPDICSLYQILHTSKADYILLEVSSHALMQGRTRGLMFRLAIWTNLSPEHLDYHGTMEHYLAAKLRICTQSHYGIFNRDDEYYNSFASRLKHDSYGLEDITLTPKPFGYVCNLAQTLFEVNVLGEHNIRNMLAVFTALGQLGYTVLERARALMELTTPEGRMNNVGLAYSREYDIFVDYAHTPDALYQSIMTLQEHTSKPITLVFGCGGDRDTSKRDKMGNIASEYADRIILTNDNPRTEDPEAIISDIASGIKETYEVILDRELAIHAALEDRNTHVILLAGKGHETLQIIGSECIPSNDTAIVANYLTK